MSENPNPLPPAAEERHAAVLDVLNRIVDPCSRTIGHPLGLCDMGMVERVEVTGDSIAVTLLPTFPACVFLGFFEAEVERHVLALPWCQAVTVKFCPATTAWDESRMSPAAHAVLNRPAKSQRPALARGLAR
jgi:metal-sulfur cluster biosynthetic enzyme